MLGYLYVLYGKLDLWYGCMFELVCYIIDVCNGCD